MATDAGMGISGLRRAAHIMLSVMGPKSWAGCQQVLHFLWWGEGGEEEVHWAEWPEGRAWPASWMLSQGTGSLDGVSSCRHTYRFLKRPGCGGGDRLWGSGRKQGPAGSPLCSNKTAGSGM